MPKAEEEKDPTKRKGTGAISGGMSDPIDFDSAKECVLLYAISILMIPTRLQTALDLYVETEN